MAIYIPCEPRSEDWFRLKLGVPSASEFHRIVTPTGKISSQAEGYAHRLLAELMLGKQMDSVETEWMQRGTDLEGQAIDAYEFHRGVETDRGGFVLVDDRTYGCSPDRLVGKDGLCEFKCPAPNTMIGYLLDPSSVESEKKPQVQGQMLVCEREFVDLVAFHPEMPIVVRRVKRDEKYLGTLKTALETFVQQLAMMREKLEREHGPFRPLTQDAPPDDEDPLGFDVTPEDISQMLERGVSTVTEGKR